jgi:NAD(P)H-dependent FMN reductase
MTVSLAVLVGSLRAGSANRRLAEAIHDVTPDGVLVRELTGLAALPLYDEDLDRAPVPAPVQRLRDEIGAADAVVLVMPENNGTVPAVVKNAIDWASRPYGASCLSGLPAVAIGGASGLTGGAHAHAEARHALGVAGARPLADVTFSVPDIAGRYAHLHPRDDSWAREQLAAVVRRLCAAIDRQGTAA